MPALPPLVGNRCIVPDDTDVANALGAVVGQVRVSAEALVSQPVEGRLPPVGRRRRQGFPQRGRGAWRRRGERASDWSPAARGEAGTDTAEIEVSRDVNTSIVESQRMFIEAHVVAVATGRPRIAA